MMPSSNPGMATRIIARFEGYPGRYVWHCYILEHEDNEMMRPYKVVSASSTSSIALILFASAILIVIVVMILVLFSFRKKRKSR